MRRWPGDPREERTTFGGLSRGRLMSRIRSTGNATTEQRLASLLRRTGVKGWRRHKRMLGHPDFIWSTARVAVFVDGCFWHGHNCGRNLTPKTNASAWAHKISKNEARDRKVTAQLRRRGWKVIRIWECRLKNNPAACVTRIKKLVDGIIGP